MEHRWYPRYTIDLPAKLIKRGESESFPCRIKDYGMGGLYVVSKVPLRRHQLIEVHPEWPHDSRWVVYGQVIHVQEDGVGIEAAEPYWPNPTGLRGYL